MALVLLVLLGNSVLANAFSLRQPSASKQVTFTVSAGTTAVNQVRDDVNYEVVKKESISRNTTTDCLCKLGSFWHWRIKSCIKQGGWAYECGFFPAEHHDKVCQDGLKCEVLNQTRVTSYHGHPGAVPASCQECEKQDKCLTGQERHSESCLKEYLLSGSACQTVRVTVTATASAKATEKVTKSSTASATATATASQKATAKDGAQVASATKEAKADGEATATAKASGEATAKAEATEEGSAEGEACVTVEEVKKILKLANVPRIGAVLSTQVVSKGDELAFDRAYAKALDAARKAGLLNAKEAAKAAAAAEAREHAGLEAEAKADEAAAWKAEAGAEKNAQEKAKADALAKAEEAASQEAADAAKAAADAADAANKGGSQEAADAAAKAAAEAKAKQDAIKDLMNPKPTQAPVRPTTPEPTNAPRKITPEQIAAGLP